MHCKKVIIPIEEENVDKVRNIRGQNINSLALIIDNKVGIRVVEIIKPIFTDLSKVIKVIEIKVNPKSIGVIITKQSFIVIEFIIYVIELKPC